MQTATITKTVFFGASRDTVWSFLTDKDKLGEWFHPAREHLVAGSDYELYGEEEGAKCWGSVLEAEQPDRLVYTFTFGPIGGKPTTVTWTLEESCGGTRLTLVHEGIAEAAGDAALGLLQALDAGWDAHLARLREANA